MPVISRTISYPGLSAELTIDQNFESNNFYELVSSCGVFCRLPRNIQVHLMKSLKQNSPDVEGIIFITDNDNAPRVKDILSESKIAHHILGMKIVSNINELGLRVNQTTFNNSAEFKRLLNNYPQYLVIVSTPYSCPDLAAYVSDKDSLVNRSALFYFENKRVYCKKYQSEMGFISYVENLDWLSNFLANTSDSEKFFIKPDGNFVGGSNILVLDKRVFQNDQNTELMRRFLSYYNCGLYKKLTSANITSHDGEHNGTQFRPFIDASGSLASFAIKFSSYAQKSTIKRTSLKRLNQAYNSSSGNSTSIIFDCRKEITPIMLSFGKNKLTTDKKTIDEYVSGLYINGSALSDQEVLSKISEQIQGKMLSISGYFEEFFFEQSWSELYDKFVLSQTYFDN